LSDISFTKLVQFNVELVHSFIRTRQDWSDAITVKTASGALYNNIRKTELQIESAME